MLEWWWDGNDGQRDAEKWCGSWRSQNGTSFGCGVATAMKRCLCGTFKSALITAVDRQRQPAGPLRTISDARGTAHIGDGDIRLWRVTVDDHNTWQHDAMHPTTPPLCDCFYARRFLCMSVCPLITQESVGRLLPNFQGSSRAPPYRSSFPKFLDPPVVKYRSFATDSNSTRSLSQYFEGLLILVLSL